MKSTTNNNSIEVKPHKRAKEESSDEELIETGQEKRLRLAKQYLDDIKEQGIVLRVSFLFSRSTIRIYILINLHTHMHIYIYIYMIIIRIYFNSL